MRSRSNLLGFGLVSLGLSLAAASSAAPVVVYPQLDGSASNALTVVQVTGSPDCPIGLGNCLANSPVAIDSASVTLDLGTNDLLNLNIFAAGPGVIDLNGYNGYEQIIFNNATFQSTGTTTLGPGGSFAILGTVTASSLELFLAGNLTAIPDIVVNNYTTAPNFNVAAGTIGISGNQLSVSVNGIDLGTFPDPQNGNLATVKMDFGFVAVVPEPDAALLYGIGLLIASSVVRRRSVPVAG